MIFAHQVYHDKGELHMDKKVHEITETVEENAVYAVVDGRLKRLDSPSSGFGKQEIVWQNSKIVQNNVYFTQKL